MRTVEILHHVTSDDLGPLQSLFAAAHRAGQREPLSDHLRLDLLHGGGRDFAGILLWGPDRLRPLAYAQLSATPTSRLLQVVTDPEHSVNEHDLVEEALATALTEAQRQGGGLVQWWVPDPTALHDDLAEAFGLRADRDLLQMRCALPLRVPGPERPAVTVRAFRPGDDDVAWVALNNRAFAGHPEQGDWTIVTLQQRMEEPWFDPEGLLLHEADDQLVGFCWTKAHLDTDPPMGEIYVIGVDPSVHGRGLGRGLTKAGLDHLATYGLGVGMLYVDAANSPAVHLYRNLGFEVHHTDRAYVIHLPEPAKSP